MLTRSQREELQAVLNMLLSLVEVLVLSEVWRKYSVLEKMLLQS